MSRDRNPTDHDRFDELAVGWALHALEPEDEAAFTRHLPGCARCARTVAETSDVMAAMAADLPPAEPSEELRHRLAAAVGETEQVHAREPRLAPAPVPTPVRADEPDAGFRPTALPSQRRPGWRRALPMSLVAAAVAAILGLGVWNVVLAQSQQNLQSAVAEQSQVMSALLSPGQAAIAPLSDNGRTVATVVAHSRRVDVVTNGLPVNDRGTSTYVLWGMQGNTPVALGTFDVAQSRMDLRTVGSGQTGLDHYSTFGISIEPGRQAPAKPTKMVALGEVTS
ncbi:MAG: anti-sigma factor [Blastococcus sp.]